MNRRFGPAFLFVSLLALFLLPCPGWSAPQVAPDAVYAKKIQAMLPPKVECLLSSPNVVTGQSVTLTAQVQGTSAGLVYSFSSNGGKFYPDGARARLDTTGVSAGSTISATCQVTNGLGQKGSSSVVVHVVAVQATKMPGHAPVAESAQVAAKNGLGGNGGSPQGGVPPKTAHDHVAQTAHVAEDQAAPVLQTAGAAGAPHVPPAVAAVPLPPPPAAGGGDPYQESEQLAQWVSELKNGKIDYLIPPQMKLHETIVVTVVVHGYADTSQSNNAAAKAGTLKVSPRMQVQLTAEDNPDEFEIDPKVGAILPVPIDGSATWMWNVMPKQPAKNQTLTVRALLVYPGKGHQTEQAFPSYIATVNVSVPGFWESLREAFWNDPSAAIKYVLPGGAGFTALAGLIVWWWKRKHPSESKANKEE